MQWTLSVLLATTAKDARHFLSHSYGPSSTYAIVGRKSNTHQPPASTTSRLLTSIRTNIQHQLGNFSASIIFNVYLRVQITKATNFQIPIHTMLRPLITATQPLWYPHQLYRPARFSQRQPRFFWAPHQLAMKRSGHKPLRNIMPTGGRYQRLSRALTMNKWAARS